MRYTVVAVAAAAAAVAAGLPRYRYDDAPPTLPLSFKYTSSGHLLTMASIRRVDMSS
jgi:hypothetical protein